MPYLLRGGPEAERLRVQAAVFAADTQTLLDAVGVQPGWCCADLACGPVGILAQLSGRVGPTGRVLGVDLDPDPARSFARAEGLANVELVGADAFGTGLPDGCCDFVHARAFAVVAGSAEALIREMARVARPGGVVAVVEPAGNPPMLDPPCPAHDRIFAAVATTFARARGDMGIGLRVPALLRARGLRPVHVRAFAPALPGGHPYARNTLEAARSLRGRIVGQGLMTAEAFERDMEEALRHVRDPRTLYVNFTMIAAWGMRPRPAG